MANSRRVVFLLWISLLVEPFAYAAPEEAEVRALIKLYVDAFNTGNSRGLVDDVYSLGDLEKQDKALVWDQKFDALRREDFGRLDLYGVRICSRTEDSAVVEMRYSFQYTFGGVMPPGDQALRLRIQQTPPGLRVVDEMIIPFDEQRACQE